MADPMMASGAPFSRFCEIDACPTSLVAARYTAAGDTSVGFTPIRFRNPFLLERTLKRFSCAIGRFRNTLKQLFWRWNRFYANHRRMSGFIVWVCRNYVLLCYHL
jgi:hypothetical protein